MAIPPRLPTQSFLLHFPLAFLRASLIFAASSDAQSFASRRSDGVHVFTHGAPMWSAMLQPCGHHMRHRAIAERITHLSSFVIPASFLLTALASRARTWGS